MRSLGFAATFLAALTFIGCHSRYIAATVVNRSSAAISPLEVDYPSASFGVESLAPGATFHYRFKVLGDGPTAVLWTDAAHRDYKSTGPQLREGDEGSLTIIIGGDPHPAWDLELANRRP